MESFKFRRLFSTNFCKSMKIELADMAFGKDFINDTHGDLYPILSKSNDCTERIEHNTYIMEKGYVNRFLCRFFPYASYEITVSSNGNEAGFCFNFPAGSVSVTVKDSCVLFTDGDSVTQKPFDKKGSDTTMIVSFRPYVCDVYILINKKPEYVDTFKSESFKDFNKECVFQNSSACVLATGKSVITGVKSYIDNGLSTADIRPVKYENGDVIYEHGRVFLTASIRMQAEMFQGVFSWVPGTEKFELCGAMFFNTGDGYIFGDVASSLLYHRQEKMWYLWVCSFAHGHILGHAKFEGEPRFGVNTIDIQLMQKASDTDKYTAFAGFEGDEDPDFYYDEEKGKWRMAICRLVNETRKYRYAFFESDNPFDGYRYIGTGTADGAQETGGSFIKIEGKRYFVCGNSFDIKSNYRMYSEEGMTNPSFDYPDGGFRGWGSIIPVKMGSRTRYFHLTFDRHNATEYNWSYGNIYCFEMEI